MALRTPRGAPENSGFARPLLRAMQHITYISGVTMLLCTQTTCIPIEKPSNGKPLKKVMAELGEDSDGIQHVLTSSVEPPKPTLPVGSWQLPLESSRGFPAGLLMTEQSVTVCIAQNKFHVTNCSNALGSVSTATALTNIGEALHEPSQAEDQQLKFQYPKGDLLLSHEAQQNIIDELEAGLLASVENNSLTVVVEDVPYTAVIQGIPLSGSCTLTFLIEPAVEANNPDVRLVQK